MEKFSSAGFMLRDLNKQNHCNNNIENFQITKPIIICLGGNGTTTPKDANSQASRNERLLGLKPNDNNSFATYQNIDIISIYYGKNKESDQVGSLSTEESESLINQLFIPLFIDKNTNKRLSLETACENFSQVIFSSFCYGAECVNDLMYDLEVKLLKLGYNQEEIFQIFSHSFHLSYSPFKQDEFLPFVQLNSFQDEFAKTFEMDKYFEHKFGYKLDGIKITYDKKHAYRYMIDRFLKPNQKEIRVYTSKLVNTENNIGKYTINEHSSLFIDLDKNWRANEKSQKAKNSECVSIIAGLNLAMAGARALNIKRKKEPVEATNLQNFLDASQSVLDGYNEEDLMSK